MPQMKTAQYVEVRFDGDDFVGMVPSVNFQHLLQQFQKLQQFALNKLNCRVDWASLFTHINSQGIPSFHCVNTSIDFGTMPDEIEPPNEDILLDFCLRKLPTSEPREIRIPCCKVSSDFVKQLAQ
ncbi:hypothetical protein AAVH_43751, partial [Aphelenchoides avenae]